MEFIIWFGLAIAVGFWATANGREGFGWGILAVIISPLIAGIILLFLITKDAKTKQEKEERDLKIRQEQELREAEEKEALIQKTTVRSEDFVMQIEKSFKLLENNLLNEEEFVQKKQAVIADLLTKKLREAPEDFLSALIPLIKKNALTQEEIVSIKKSVL